MSCFCSLTNDASAEPAASGGAQMSDLKKWSAAILASTLALGCVAHEATRDIEACLSG